MATSGQDKFQRNNVLLESAALKRPLEQKFMLLRKSLAPMEAWPTNVGAGAVGGKMTGAGGGIS